ncbi:hypothetical protein [Candidatus Palauibacter sp.]|uniref:hypothetical protein n=1 Tax=Candidatus Palauibacter sp. TaxID=3101350 RepID=UPI003AF2F669
MRSRSPYRPCPDDVPRSVRGIGHEVGAVGILHLVARDYYLAVRGRQERLLSAMDIRVAGLVGEDVPVLQPDEIEGEPLVVGDDVVVGRRRRDG